MVLFVLYFDINERSSQLYYSKLNFATVLDSIYSSYTIFTFENNLNLMNFTLTHQPLFLSFLIPMMYSALFIFVFFIMARICYSYSKTIRERLGKISLKHKGFKKILTYFEDKRGFIDGE